MYTCGDFELSPKIFIISTEQWNTQRELNVSMSGQEKKRINIFPFTTSFFENVSDFEHYVREILPDILTVEHTQVRKPDLMVFAYQGDHSLWGYAEIEGWKDPNETEAAVGIEWGGGKFRRLYKIKPCSLKEFKKHIPYAFLLSLGLDTTSIVYAPVISVEIFNQLLKEAEGEINLCIH